MLEVYLLIQTSLSRLDRCKASMGVVDVKSLNLTFRPDSVNTVSASLSVSSFYANVSASSGMLSC